MSFHSHAEGDEGHHHHHQAPTEFNGAFLISIIANTLFVIVQIVFAILANSTSLLADAIHNLGDVLSLILAWIAHRLMKRSPTANATYGFKKTSILAALANGSLLLFTCGIIVTEVVYKLIEPSEVASLSVMLVAGIGIVVNGLTALLFVRGSDDLNIRAAFLHLLYDALVSVGVVVAAFLIYLTHWYWLDPLAGLLIALVILRGTWSLFTDSFRLILDAVPRGISWEAVRDLLLQQAGVEGVHDLHIWALSTQENALSAHLYMPEQPMTDEARKQLEACLMHDHQINHVTIQIERTESHCEDNCKH